MQGTNITAEEKAAVERKEASEKMMLQTAQLNIVRMQSFSRPAPRAQS